MAWGQNRSNRDTQIPKAQKRTRARRPDAARIAVRGAALLITRPGGLSEPQVDPIESIRLTEG
jgi:hypothetical protein